jgi:hypothetical protein
VGFFADGRALAGSPGGRRGGIAAALNGAKLQIIYRNNLVKRT